MNITNDLNNFYTRASGYNPNKFLVSLDGQYVDNAITELNGRLLNNSNNLATSVNSADVADWKTNHVVNGTDGYKYKINMLWACKSVTIPGTTITYSLLDDTKGFIMDTTRNLNYKFVTGVDQQQKIQMTIMEEKGIPWYHFLNELGNQFFDARLMTPRDSVEKMRIIVEPILHKDEIHKRVDTGDYESDAAPITRYSKGQKFEFNSVVYTQMGDLKYSTDDKKLTSYNVNFNIVNPFQKTFKHNADGLLNRTSDDDYIIDNFFNIGNFEANIASDAVAYEKWVSDSSRARR